MTAGQGAEQQAQRAAARAERLERELERARRSQVTWGAGADGERLVGERLDRLRGHGWLALHDVRWPGRPKANLDHVVVGPGGVVVVDAKNWTGTADVRDGVLRHNGRKRLKHTESVLTQSAAVAAVLPPGVRRHVKGCLCLVGHGDLQERTADGAVVLGLERLERALLALPQVLAPDAVERLGRDLPGLLEQGVPAGALTEPTPPPALVTPEAPGRPRLGLRLLVASGLGFGAVLALNEVLRLA
ncbi:NERD domain-containing protein [Vallicoccus soli]|uniref:NERD domain-containing protein n=1 Tax=Vallicoccus soli TaxID=2339232 RepID=A0A3A3YXJ5_9ACTN|nr:NERD domain-containing protein [Vallicoccus soli]RJK96399.1 NERD domain-containing protein [Vallicoccus soli]